MDHAGAVAGPLLAAAFLWAWPGDYRLLFALTLVPGMLVVALLFRLPADEGAGDVGRSGADENVLPVDPRAAPRIADSGRPQRARMTPSLWRAFAVFGIFSLGNSTDAYLLLRLGHVLPSAVFVPVAWAALHVVKVFTSLLGGAMADRFGRKLSITAGWVVYTAVYAIFASTGSAALLVAAFLAYGGYFGLTEGAEKALVADLAPASVRGTAFGTYNAVVGLGALAASILFGLVWEWQGPGNAFLLGASLAALATVLLWTSVPGQRPDDIG
jgi:MFS family permease